MADITLLNMNMLYVRYTSHVEQELHVPLGPLYLVRVLEEAGGDVDFRDYQTNTYDDPFSAGSICDFLSDSSSLVGVSVMTNLLPFTLAALREYKEHNPDATIVLGGVGPKAVEETVLTRFPWIDAIASGEGERMIVPLVEAHRSGAGFARVPGMFWRAPDGTIRHNPPPPRIEDLDEVPFPAWHRIDLERYQGYGLMTSRGCPYPCTFCSVAPIWGRTATRRSHANIVAEMTELRRRAGVELFLFQDEYFLVSADRTIAFCDAMHRAGLDVAWKAFGRVNLSEPDMMRRMAATGCVEMRFGIESGSDEVLERTRKGFTTAQAVEVVGEATRIFDRVDTFYVWGYPFETMEDFRKSVFQMVSFRLMGARILPSLLSFLPQTDIYLEYGEDGAALEFCRGLFPEYMLTGHEVCRDARVEIDPAHAPIFDLVAAHPDVFPGFFHYDLEGNVRPKLAILEEMGFYPSDSPDVEQTDSCGAHSPRVGQATTARAQLSASG